MPAKKVSLESIKPSPKKPSLASLRSNNTSRAGAAAQKRAVNRIVATVSTKTAAKKVTIRDKRVVAVKPKQKTPASKSSSSNRAIKSPFVQEDFSVQLPSNMSIRAREKALAILSVFTEDFQQSAQKVAYISGLSFVVLGGYMALAFMGMMPHIDAQFALIGGVTNSTTTIGTTQSLTNQTSSLPVFSVQTPMPPQVTAPFGFTFSISSAKDVQARIVPLQTGGHEETLNVDSLTNDTFRINVDPTKYPSGRYFIKVGYKSSYTDTAYYQRTIDFYVINPNVQAAVATTTSADTSGSGTSDSAGTSGTTDTQSDTTETAVSGETSDTVATETAASSTQSVAEEKVVVSETIKLILPTTNLTGKASARAEVSPELSNVALYIRPDKSIIRSPIASGLKGTSNWYFSFDTLNKPNGDYFLIVLGTGTGGLVESNQVKVRIYNSTIVDPVTGVPIKPVLQSQPKPAPVEPSESVEAAGEEEEEVAQTASPVRSFSETTFDEQQLERPVPEDLDTKTDAVFVIYRDELSDLMKRYAVAKQSGDPLVMDLALKELEAAKKRIVTESLMDTDLNHFANDLDREFTERLDVMKKHINTFEELRRSAGTEDMWVDTDKDGVSDFDERSLYNTNPEEADSDNDGFQDGIEIMRGFDPLNESAEAVINYELPQDSLGLIQEDVLKVEDVKPLIKSDESNPDPEVQAEIRGKGLPNSYVTIYIFSTPTIVTVRTDKDGSFVYNFEKELEDGEHEVYVAVTDNTGAIVARSNPFKFIKEAEAFTPANAIQTESVDSMSLSDFKSLNMYNIVVGVGVLALGLILLMLGIGLREKDKFKMIMPLHDIKAP